MTPLLIKSLPSKAIRLNEKKVFSLVLAFVGIIYELAFAQILSVTLGNTFLRYSTTIGLFTLSLGVSSLLFEQVKFKLIHYQIILFLTGLLGPLWIVFFQPLYWAESYSLFCEWMSYLPVIIVGLASGFELPLLMRDASSQEKSKLLGYDYFGMFLGTLLFPLWLLPSLGVNGSLYFAAAINFLGAMYLYARRLLET